jgi:hypothetical protein
LREAYAETLDPLVRAQKQQLIRNFLLQCFCAVSSSDLARHASFINCYKPISH